MPAPPPPHSALATWVIVEFQCLREKCPHTCCAGWSMQVDDTTAASFRASGLGEALVAEGARTVMRRAEATQECVAYACGECAIHAERGANALGDACHFYPRAVRIIAGVPVVTGALSCPEIARLSLTDEAATAFETREFGRQPLLAARFSEDGGGLALHRTFLEMARRESTTAASLQRIFFTCSALEKLAPAQRAAAAFASLDQPALALTLPGAAERDLRLLVQIFFALLSAGSETPRHPRLTLVLEALESALGIFIDRTNLDLTVQDAGQWARTRSITRDDETLLRRLLSAKLSASLFPIAGLGDSLLEKAQLLVFRFALTRLALRSFAGPDLPTNTLVVQEIARALDHLHSAELPLRLLRDSGLADPARLLSLLHLDAAVGV